MNSKEKSPKSMNFKLRKIIHYSLILCILLIQLTIVAFFYNEFVTKKNLSFIEKQINEVNLLEKLTDDSRKDLHDAQFNFQQYITTKDGTFLKNYFESVKRLNKNLDSINQYKSKNSYLNKLVHSQKFDTLEVKNLKTLIDSTYQFSNNYNFNTKNSLPEFQKYKYDYNFEKYDVETQTFTDTVAKKGIFGRLKDAISGKVNVRKDSTVVTVKNGRALAAAKMKAEVDSIINAINKHYIREVQKIQVNVTKTGDESGKFYSTFNSLLIYSNELMNIYDVSIKNAKTELQKELDKLNSKNNKIRMYLVLGLMVLMFLVSILIMYFTRMAFIYEKKLNEANKQIKENLSFKNRILGMLSHELRSPLKIIGIFINRINKKTNDDSIKEYLKSISFTNDTLLMQANQILEYTKNQQVENKLIPVVFNLKNEIDSILNAIEPYVETRNNQFVISEDINPNIEVFSDNTKINQIFMNIIGNANKFTENGKIEVVTFAKNLDQNTVCLTTTINDTGAGISKSDLEQIFEPYYQGVLSDKVENLGAGLGLSLCKEIVELYSGTISVASEIGKGTSVTFAINLKLNNEPRR